MAVRLTDDERAALRYAIIPLVPMERLELLHFLEYPSDLPQSYNARVEAVVTQILNNRTPTETQEV